jgi:MFS family permease
LTHFELLRLNKPLRQLTYVQFIAYFGAWFSNVAIYTMLVQFDASAFIIATVTAFHFLPGVILSPFNGSIVDRIDVKKLMYILLATEMSMTFSFLFINNIDDVWLLMLLLFIRMGSASIFFTTEMTLLPKLLSGEALIKANEIHSMIWSFTFTAGMALGGVVVTLFGVKTSFMIDGVFFLIAIIILSQIQFNVVTEKVTHSMFQTIKDGFEYLKNNKYLFHYMFLHSTVGFTIFDTIVTLLADQNYKYVIAIPLAIGFTNGIRALALMIGPIFLSSWITKERMFYMFLAQGGAIILWALLQYDFYLGLVGMFLVGLTTTTIWSYTYTMLQEEVERKYLGRVLAYNEMIFMLSTVITTFFIGIMASIVPLMVISIILGVAFIGVAYYYKRIFL